VSPPVIISVLLPARDAALTVGRALDSILGQTFRGLEVLAVDDGSRDETLSVLRAAARADPRVQLLHGGGRGLPAALNLALSRARGRYVARMDADDESLPGRLERSRAALEADSTLWAVGTQVEIFREDRPVTPNMRLYERWLNSLTDPARLARERFIESPLCHPSTLIRREALDRAGGWREGDFPEDYQLWLELLDAGGRLKAIEPVLFRWRDHEARVTWADPRYRPEAIVGLKARYLARHAPVRGRRVVVWGAGGLALRLARGLRGEGVEITRLVDLSPRKVGQRVDGWPVVRPEALGPPGSEHVIAAVGAKGAREEIRAFLAGRGWSEGPDFTCAA
jgi:glycosyltransferase involved in cell wall biosynthesis